MITEEQNKSENGYGRDSKLPMMQAFAKAYMLDYFPTYDEVRSNVLQSKEKTVGSRYAEINTDVYLDCLAYKNRMLLTLEPIILEANNRVDKKNFAVLRMVGLGLGVWKIHDEQIHCFLQAVIETVKGNTLNNLCRIEFQYMDVTKPGTHLYNHYDLANKKEDQSLSDQMGNEIDIEFTRGNPADKLLDDGEELVAVYAW